VSDLCQEAPEEKRGFSQSFVKSKSYSRWQEIGKTNALENDDDIATYLMK
jgi:hypothetical protein